MPEFSNKTTIAGVNLKLKLHPWKDCTSCIFCAHRLLLVL